MPDVFKIYVRQCLIGFGIAAVFVAVLLWFDVAGLRSLIAGSDIGLMALFMLWFFNGIVFAGVQFGIHVMMMAEREDDGGAGRRQQMPEMATEFLPVRVRSEAGRSVLNRILPRR
ncbi:MAG: hypothetical protein ACWA5A_05030 [Marinibacterium sp.]